MFDPTWEKGCPGCTLYVDELGNLSMLNERNTAFAIISRAPLSKLAACFDEGQGTNDLSRRSFAIRFKQRARAALISAVPDLAHRAFDVQGACALRFVFQQGSEIGIAE